MSNLRTIHLFGGPLGGQKIEVGVTPDFKIPKQKLNKSDKKTIGLKSVTYTDMSRRCAAGHRIAVWENDPRLKKDTIIPWHLGQIPLEFSVDIPRLYNLTEAVFKEWVLALSDRCRLDPCYTKEKLEADLKLLMDAQ